MTQEERQLLLVDLCARLPYGVNVQPSGSAAPHIFKGYDKGLVRIDTDQRYEFENIKPYLRTLSSMTDEEKILMATICLKYANGNVEGAVSELSVFYNSRHFDYRGLIPMGLALEAPEDMYKTE